MNVTGLSPELELVEVYPDHQPGRRLGGTVQVIPHITDEIKRRIIAGAEGAEVGLERLTGGGGPGQGQAQLVDPPGQELREHELVHEEGRRVPVVEDERMPQGIGAKVERLVVSQDLQQGFVDVVGIVKILPDFGSLLAGVARIEEQDEEDEEDGDTDAS